MSSFKNSIDDASKNPSLLMPTKLRALNLLVADSGLAKAAEKATNLK